MRKSNFVLPWLLLSLALILAACGAAPTLEAGKRAAEPATTDRAAQVETATSVASATPRPTTTPRPTPTWMPLPSPPPTDSGPGRGDVPLLGVGEAWALAASGEAVFVDVRPRGNYEQEHIPDAVSMPAAEASMPADQVAERYEELPDDRLLIFYCNCKAEVGSIEAALAALEQGREQVAALHGGWQAWLQAGYPVAGASVESEREVAPERAMGSPDAPITMVEFSEFQCPYCAMYSLETLPQIVETYVDTGLVRYVFKDLPLPFHPHAQKAAEAGRCAGAQDRFWPMHDLLFEHQEAWSALDEAGALAAFVGYADELGLDRVRFQECLASGEFSEAVARDQSEAERLGIRAVPSFLINDQRMAGAYPFADFQRLIEAELAQEP